MQMGGGGTFVRRCTAGTTRLAAPDRGTFTVGPARVRGMVRNCARKRSPSPWLIRVRRRRRGVLAAAFPRYSQSWPAFPGLGVEDDTPPAEPRAGPRSRNFLRVQSSKIKAYVGDQITVEWFLYLTERQTSTAPRPEPRTDGFWSRSPRPQSTRWAFADPADYEGRNYLVAPLIRRRSSASSGRLTISPLESENLACRLLRRNPAHRAPQNRAFDHRSSPLPTAASPPSSTTSRWAISLCRAEVDRDRSTWARPVTLKLAISGQGNLRKLAAPTLPRLDG